MCIPPLYGHLERWDIFCCIAVSTGYLWICGLWWASHLRSFLWMMKSTIFRKSLGLPKKISTDSSRQNRKLRFPGKKLLNIRRFRSCFDGVFPESPSLYAEFRRQNWGYFRKFFSKYFFPTAMYRKSSNLLFSGSYINMEESRQNKTIADTSLLRAMGINRSGSWTQKSRGKSIKTK